MGKEIFRTRIKRQKGKLYYIRFDEFGFLIICEAELSRGGKKK